ncbi:hypothetical protein ACFXAF_18410 [Kitasatospora sp. NPDC059463]|uniref:hypothetical protein n=1 Tax=unclassified Kitasatospora TaxID=2633591 RepID=UPI0036CB85CC
MRIITTAGRSAAVALAVAALGPGATTSARAVPIGGGTTVVNGGCSVRLTLTGGGVVVRSTVDNDTCTLTVIDTTTSTRYVSGPLGNGVQVVVVGTGDELTGCLLSRTTGRQVCVPVT